MNIIITVLLIYVITEHSESYDDNNIITQNNENDSHS